MSLCLGLFSGFARAQSTTQGAIAGTVVDASGAVVPGAAVTLHNDGTSAEFKLVADASGYFKAPLVPPGTYTVTISAHGIWHVQRDNGARHRRFSDAIASGIEDRCDAGDGRSDRVAPVIQFESPEVSSTLTTQEIVNLPLNGGRWSNLALLTPGAASDSNGFGLISFRGISPILNNVEIDGADNNQAFFSEERGRTRAGYSTSQIAIAEFQVNTGVYSAEYGRSAGGVLERSNEERYQPAAWPGILLRSRQCLGSPEPFHDDYTSVTVPSGGGTPTIVTGVPFQPKDWRKRWGFGAGGKLIKNKLFWFYAYDQFSGTFPALQSRRRPSAFFNQWADLTLPSNATCVTSATKGRDNGEREVYRHRAHRPAITKPAHWHGASMAADYARQLRSIDQLLFGSAVSSVTGLNTPGLLDDLGPTPRTGDEVLNTPKTRLAGYADAARERSLPSAALGFARRRADAGVEQLRNRHASEPTS